MARAVVEGLEEINIDHDQGTLGFVPSEPQELTGQGLVKITPVGQTRQGVLVTQLLQALVGFTQPGRLELQGLAQLPQFAGALVDAVFQAAVDLEQFLQFELRVGHGVLGRRRRRLSAVLAPDIDHAGTRQGQVAVHHLAMKLGRIHHEPGQRCTRMRHRHQAVIARIARQTDQHIGHRDTEAPRHFVRNLMRQRRLHRARNHGKNRYPLPGRHLFAQRQHHGPQAHFLRAVGAHERHALQRNQRHEGATPARQHARQGVFGQQHRSAQVGAVGLVPVIDGTVNHRVHLQARSAVEHAVDRTKAAFSRRHQRRHPRLGADVNRHKVCRSAGLAYRLGDRFAGGRKVGQHHIGAQHCHGARRLRADAACATRNQDDLTGQNLLPQSQ